jgi:dipeptidyl aminopeptidase/acylaminoacyl peptidase
VEMIKRPLVRIEILKLMNKLNKTLSYLCAFLLLVAPVLVSAQHLMTPETLWKLGRVGAQGISMDGETLIYSVRTYDAESNNGTTKYFSISIKGGIEAELPTTDGLLKDRMISPDGKHKLYDEAVKIQRVTGSDYYPELTKSEVYIYDDLMYRHWDQFADGTFSHVFISDVKGGNAIDLMSGQAFHCPTRPFGGSEDYMWSNDGKNVLYVTKQKAGKAYAVSTNTDIFSYNLATQKTTNLTEGMMGYDNSPAYASTGTLAWLSMKRDGYESDKNDIFINTGTSQMNLTKDWDGTVSSFMWAADGKKIYFIAPVGGTKHIFQVTVPVGQNKPEIKQISSGQFDATGLVGISNNILVFSRTDMNHASELYTLDLGTSKIMQLTHVNDHIYNNLKLSDVRKRMVTTTDGKQMVTWVIYPPNFDATKKYPTLLYCQGGPQGALSQFYSFRWNFQVMAAKGYIIVAPNRRGMPGYGVEWNEQISKDYGGQNMQDYLSAIDDVAKEDYVDKDRLGCIGASYGGYSVFYLAGNHNNRFKTFIAHDGIFNWTSMYGTTEEMFFVNWDLGGAYWEKDNAVAQKAYNEFNPVNYVDKWNTPIMIYQGGKDYRVPIGQGLEAFNAAQLRDIKSRIVYLPEENHWVSTAQNSLVWQREFFRWLEETL